MSGSRVGSATPVGILSVDGVARCNTSEAQSFLASPTSETSGLHDAANYTYLVAFGTLKLKSCPYSIFNYSGGILTIYLLCIAVRGALQIGLLAIILNMHAL